MVHLLFQQENTDSTKRHQKQVMFVRVGSQSLQDTTEVIREKNTGIQFFSNTLYLKPEGVDENPLEIALVDRCEMAVLAQVSAFLCTDLRQRLINNPYPLFLSSQLSFQSSGLIWRILPECLSLDWLWGSDPYKCVCCVYLDQISGRAYTD